jgi:nitrogen-specific signal transduction histidine kinase
MTNRDEAKRWLELCREIGAELDQERTLERGLEAARKAGGSNAAVLLTDGRGDGTLYFTGGKSRDLKFVPSGELATGEGGLEEKLAALTGWKVRSVLAEAIPSSGPGLRLLILADEKSGKFDASVEAHAETVAALLGQALDRAEAAERAVRAEQQRAADNALAMVAGRLKGILGGMQAGVVLVEKALEDAENPRLKKGWHVVSKNFSQLQSLFHNIQCFGQRAEVEREACDLKKLVQGVADALREAASARGIKIKVTNGGNGGDVLPADPAELRQAVRNLIEWAIEQKTGEGPAVIEVKLVPGRAEEPFTILVRTDCPEAGGEGEDMAERSDITDAEKLQDPSTLRLATVQRILQSHGGTIRCEVADDESTIFTLHLSK